MSTGTEKVKEAISAINDTVVAQMTNEEKNGYDPEVQLPKHMEKKDIVIKKSYDLSNRETNNVNQKRRQKRPSTLETRMAEGKNSEVEELIRKQYYTTLTNISQQQEYCDEKTAKKIVQQMFAMIGCNIRNIPTAMTDEVIDCIKKWTPRAKTIYKYNREEIKPLDMNQEEMSYVYDTYILTKKIVLINCINKEDYDKHIAELNKELTPVYAAIRALKSLQ